MVESISTGKYNVKINKGEIAVYKTFGDKSEFVTSCRDLTLAMDIVEGLMLVEAKRSMYPDSKPVVEVKA